MMDVFRGPSDKGLFDNPFMTVLRVLRGFWKAHSAALKLLPIQRPKELTKYADFVSKFKESWTRAKSIQGRETK